MNYSFPFRFLGFTAVFMLSAQTHAYAASKKETLAKSFLSKVTKGFQNADRALGIENKTKEESNILPEGETLLLNVRLPRGILIDGLIFGQVRQSRIVVSMKDIAEILSFPLEISPEQQRVTGWYIRENKIFDLDIKAERALTDNGTFKISSGVFVENDDILVPIEELALWLDFEIEPRISNQELYIEPSQPLPVQEKLARKRQKNIVNEKKKPELPLGSEPYKLAGIPVVDVTTRMSYEKEGESDEATQRLSSNVTTAGDLLYGTVTTRSLYDNDGGLKSIRANYKQESSEPNLLGPLRARRFELGDVTTTSLPIVNSAGQEFGFRVTNTDPLESFARPTTVISGTTQPDWDVELYRGNQFVAFQTADEDGFFSFNNVGLFSQDNDFRLVFYGLQGEIREEDVFIPVNSNLSSSSGTYDVSVSFEDRQAYRKGNLNEDEDSDSANIAALYEIPLGAGTAASVSYRSDQFEGRRNHIGQAGLSALALETLFNFNMAVDDEGETNAELTARRNFGQHSLSGTSTWLAEGFDVPGGGAEDSPSSFRQSLNVVGAFPLDIGDNAKYSSSFNFLENAEGETNLTSSVGLNTSWRGLTFNEQISHLTADNIEEDQIASLTTLSGTYANNRIRTVVDYDIAPERALNRVVANVTREITEDIDLRAEVERSFDTRLTETSLGVDWDAGFARLSPLVTYNTDGDTFIGFNSRFSVMREPHKNDIRFSDRTISSNGGFSAFVYLDKDGDRIFDASIDEPLEDVAVKALQNGGIRLTDANGIAVFNNMAELKLTDVIVEELSLPDPLWVPGYKGLSVLPREGHIDKAEFPIHIAGEVDGTLYGRRHDGEDKPMRNVTLELYNQNGKIQNTAVTDLGGFYFFSRIPPGNYYLMISDKSAQRDGFARPLPQKIEIGYDGTLIFANDLYVELDQPDIPSEIVDHFDDLKELYPERSFDYKLALNFGEYKSRTLMTLRWYRINKKGRQALKGGAIYVAPKESYANVKTGKHTLRVGVPDQSIGKAYERCSLFIEQGIFCKVEILPQALI